MLFVVVGDVVVDAVIVIVVVVDESRKHDVRKMRKRNEANEGAIVKSRSV